MKDAKYLLIALGLILLFVLPVTAVVQGHRFGGEHLLILVSLIMIPTFTIK